MRLKIHVSVMTAAPTWPPAQAGTANRKQCTVGEGKKKKEGWGEEGEIENDVVTPASAYRLVE